jgi:nitrate reductase gamma subunit
VDESTGVDDAMAFRVPLGAGLALIVAGVGGWLTAAWGYAFLMGAGALGAAAIVPLAVLVLTRAGNAAFLARASAALARLAVASYVLAVCALAGFFSHETYLGRMEYHWVLFGPAVVVSLYLLDTGLYRKLVKNNMPTWDRYRRFISRAASEPAAMRRTLVDEVLIQRPLLGTSRVRWLRHALIFWGFVAMVVLEGLAVVFREAMPAFGMADLWRAPGHPLRQVFDFAFDLTGAMILAGCVIALAWRIAVNGTDERKFSDLPTTLFLLFVVLSGFVVEGWRIALSPAGVSHAASFVGVWFASAMTMGGGLPAYLYQPVWLVHVIGSCAFVAYVPARRLVHSCATPLGRLMNSQKGLLAAKRAGVLGALMGSAPAAPAVANRGGTTSHQV